jgi:putative oxidoreductase
VNTTRVNDLAPFIVRLAQGSLIAGHGAMKLFGTFGGPGLEGTSQFMEMLGLKPGRPWAILAGLSEFGGGVLTALGLLNPLGPLGVIGSQSMATTKAHWGKPIWVTEGGAELPVLNLAVSMALMIREPDKYALDRVLGIRLPTWIGPLGLTCRALHRSWNRRAAGGGGPGRGARGAGRGGIVSQTSLRSFALAGSAMPT